MSNRVKGPTSALSDFLRERGIKARSFHMLSPKTTQPRPLERASSDSDDNENSKERSRKRVKKEETSSDTALSKVKEEHSIEPETDLTTTITVTATRVTRSSSSRRRLQHATSTSQSVKDEDVQVDGVKVKQEESPVSTNTIIPVADIGQAMRQRRAALRRRQQGLAIDDDDDDEFVLDSKQQQQPTVAFCKQCRRRFTITSSCRVLPNGARLCVECSAKAGRLPDTELNGRGKRRGAKGSSKNTLGWWLPEDDPVVSLRNACIKMIGDNIHNMDSLGSLSERNMDKICQIICKHRQLYPNVLKLFLDPSRTTIQLYDCTKLDEDDLKSIAQFCPNIDTLSLWYCGRLSPETLLFYAERLRHLRSITLHGPFLVTDQVFTTLLETVGGQLQRFAISHSGRLSHRTLTAIAQHCSNLKELQLSGCSAVDDSDILKLADIVARQSITTLDLSGTVSRVSDDTMIAVLRVLGPELRKLNLTGGSLLTDRLLVEG
ncbi:hypothetical protein BDF22DRAFT_42250 [Syncephalis plumigaleata]|nr:hypothetical protein BDF22DRAFT_42250 [Syncephalis plumigaleata]